ncbi:MAG: hypothetical protein ACKO3N_04675, partial [Verrucomicrobiota bacterium]
LPSPAVQAAQGSLPKNPSNADLRSQLDAALKELRRVSEQRDIPKKPALWRNLWGGVAGGVKMVENRRFEIPGIARGVQWGFEGDLL